MTSVQKIVNSITCLFFLFQQVLAKRYNRCSLAMELVYQHGVSTAEVADWICLADHASGFETSFLGQAEGDGSRGPGVFQISDRWWCSQGEGYWASNGCNKPCSAFRDASLADDFNCATRIFSEEAQMTGKSGFTAWPVWKTYCQDREVQSYLTGCLLGEEERRQEGNSVEFSPNIVEFTPSVEFSPESDLHGIPNKASEIVPPAVSDSGSVVFPKAKSMTMDMNPFPEPKVNQTILPWDYKPQPGFTYNPIDSTRVNTVKTPRKGTRTIKVHSTRRKVPTSAVIPTAIKLFSCQWSVMRCEWIPEQEDFPYRCRWENPI